MYMKIKRSFNKSNRWVFHMSRSGERALEDLRYRLTIGDIQKQSAEQIEQLENRHKEATERLTERLEVYQECELLKVQGEYQARIEKMSAEANERLQAATQDITVEIHKLYSEMNQLRESLSAKTTAQKPATSTRRKNASNETKEE